MGVISSRSGREEGEGRTGKGKRGTGVDRMLSMYTYTENEKGMEKKEHGYVCC